jgi:two-component system phosphate regulon sensor histidine kinase PhoR
VRRFREGAEAVPDGILTLQEDFTIVWCNKEVIALLGLQWPTDQGQRLDNLIRRPDFLNYLSAGQYDEPLELQSPVDPLSLLEIRVTSYANSQLMMVVRDITLIKQLEEMRRDFIANVSHELRTPLTVMSGYLEMLDPEMPPPPTVWKKAQKTMLNQSNRMASLVDQLLILTRIENSDRTDFDDEIDVSSMLDAIYLEAEQLAKNKHHTITLTSDESLNVIGKEQELRSAFSNLVFNAVRYTPDNGKIEIIWQKKKQGAEFSVKDNGEGIAIEHIHRLTERFYRVDQARSRDTGGSGLGLAITKHVLSRHDSHLNISSKVNAGSKFSFFIPKERLKINKL